MQDSVLQKPPASRGPAVTFIVVVAASLIGASTGILIAERESLVGLRGNVAAEFAQNLAGRFSSGDSGVSRAATDRPGPSQNTRSKEGQEAKTILPGLSSIGAIRYSNQQDSAKVSIELEAAVLVRTAQLRDPDRISLDLRDSRQLKGTVGQLKAQKAVKIGGQLLTGVRVSQWKSGAMRIVLDLVRSCDYTCQLTPGPLSRLTVELRARPGGVSTSN